MRRSASTAVMPPSESRSRLLRGAPCRSPPSGARARVPKRTTAAEPAKLAQSTRSAPRGDVSAIRRPPGAVADDLRRLGDDAEERAPGDEDAVGQHDPRERGAHARGDGRDQAEDEEQGQQHRDGHGGERHQRHDRRRDQVAGDHQAARRGRGRRATRAGRRRTGTARTRA